jgi:DNA-binding GntR family transcriptional regulator
MAKPSIPFLTHERSRNLGDQVADSIVNAAIQGHLAPGQRLVESELADAFGVSRVPVRGALHTLGGQGIVISTANREVRLVTITAEMLEQMLSVRLILEAHATDLAFVAITKEPGLLTRFEDALDDMQRAFRKGSAFLAAQADMEFHRALYLASGNGTLLEIWDRMAKKILIAVGLSLYQNPENLVVDDHRALLEMLRAGDCKSFKQHLRPHILEALARLKTS